MPRATPFFLFRVLKPGQSTAAFHPRSAPPLRQIQSLPRRLHRWCPRRSHHHRPIRRRRTCRRRSICCPDVWLRRISYCQKEFRKIAPTYIQHAGGRSYGADADLARRSDADLAMDGLISDWEAAAAAAGCAGVRSAAENVGIVVRDPARSSPTTRIVARNGRIVVEEEENGGGPNGTEFVIATKDSPELDAAAVVVGRVVAGMDLAA
ncbi:hypothetical protein AXF42_Ash020460 [Apostasia shenzhenica]|uniref:PPIase cyclophilin-type domain-containing protein n=1 Tax=Apostasia shenzhenica TaxID=1088818 RepID=A0A2H9ZYJ1_9ASPA|nr:hypothetical protein AXF42_Ash020460 [Apostasia shenzhenica]